MAPWRRVCWLLGALVFALGWSPGSCERLHVHDMSLINNVDGFTCQPGRLYSDAMPRGISKVSVDHVKALGTEITAEECLSRCCKLGRDRCQYLWVFGEACFAIGCEEDGSINCMPQLLPSSVKAESLYVKMQYVMKDKDLDNIEETLDEQLLEKGNNEKGHTLPAPVPVADAGGDVIVRLPVEIVHLYGNKSTGHNGIKTYLWELVSDHFVRPILENPGSPILDIRNLIPGNYTFRLTVTDTDGRSSSSVVMVYVSEDAPTTPSEVGGTHSYPDATIGKTGLTSGNQSAVDVEGEDSAVEEESSDEIYYRKRRIVLKIVVPVLVSVAVILMLSAAIVGLSACLCERNRRRMRRFYRYKKIPDTIAKT